MRIQRRGHRLRSPLAWAPFTQGPSDRGLRLRSARRIAPAALSVAAIAALALLVSAPAAPGAGNSAAVITGEFSDSCRDFTAHSSKDISHVVIRYVDGRMVNDESTTTPDYAIDGSSPGDEIGSVDVKSGQTRESFTCTATNTPPTAVLEVHLWPECELVDEPSAAWGCHVPFHDPTLIEPNMWVDAGSVGITCGDGGVPCEITLTFRRTSSTDPENDITSWSIAFDGVTSAGGAWADPPTEVSFNVPPGLPHEVTLTVTDAAGQSDSDTMTLFHGTPD